MKTDNLEMLNTFILAFTIVAQYPNSITKGAITLSINFKINKSRFRKIVNVLNVTGLSLALQ